MARCMPRDQNSINVSWREENLIHTCSKTAPICPHSPAFGMIWSQILQTLTYRAPGTCKPSPPDLLQDISCTPLLLTVLRYCCPPCSNLPGLPLPQHLCRCCSLCPKCSSPRYLWGWLPHSLHVGTPNSLSHGCCLCAPDQNFTLPGISYLLPFLFFLHSTYNDLTSYIFTYSYCLPTTSVLEYKLHELINCCLFHSLPSTWNGI